MSARCLRWFLLVLAVALFAPASLAQPEFCLPDADHDGHPMFGNPQVRIGFETYQGQAYFARSPVVAFGDLDGDGDADALAVSYRASGPLSFVTVHLNAGDGVFGVAEVPYPVGWEGTDVALGDLDGDTDLDAAVPNARDNTVSILFNHGDATFAPHVVYPVGLMPRSLRVADLDGDGDRDLAVLNVESDDVSILLNNGDGTFAPEVRVFVGFVTARGDPNLTFAYPGPFLAVGDLNGDGNPDIAVPSFSKVKLLLNDGRGGFALAPAHPSVAVQNAYAVAIADLDGDLDADLAVTSLHEGVGGPNILSVILNTGGGVFAPPVPYNAGTIATPQYATSITAGDIDGDLDLDLVVGHELGSRVMLMRNLGDGAFAPKEEVRVFGTPWCVRFAELNGDSRLDLAVLTMAGRSKLCVLLNDGAGSVMTAARYPPASAAAHAWNWMESADLDGDGDKDLVVSQSGSGPYDVIVLLNDGAGAFAITWSTILWPGHLTTGESVSIGDLNGDGVPDLVVCDAVVNGGFDQPGRVWALIGKGDGTFEDRTAYPLSGLFPKHSAIADLDGDGDRDVAVWTCGVYPGNDQTPVDRRIVLLRNDGAGGLSEAGQLVVNTVPYPFPLGGLLACDLNGDGLIDVLGSGGTRTEPGRLAVFLNLGGMRFVQFQHFEVPPQPESLASADINGDGVFDVLLLHNHNFIDGVLEEPYLTAWSNDGKGWLSPALARTDPRAISLGRLAVAVSPRERPIVGIGLAFGGSEADVLPSPSSTKPLVAYGTGNWPTAIVLEDFNGDGRLDLAACNSSDANVTVVLNRACGGCYADCDGDGVLSAADFFCFQTKYTRLDPYGDCNADASLTIADFGCFQNKYVLGCP